MSIDHIVERAAALLVVGISAGTLAACSGQLSASAPTTRPGAGELTVRSGPALTKLEASKLVKDGCASLGGVEAAVASVDTADGRGSSNAFPALVHGPWYKVVSISSVGTFPEFTRIAANAKALDANTIASLNGAGLAGVASSVAKLSGACRTLGLPTE